MHHYAENLKNVFRRRSTGAGVAIWRMKLNQILMASNSPF